MAQEEEKQEGEPVDIIPEDFIGTDIGVYDTIHKTEIVNVHHLKYNIVCRLLEFNKYSDQPLSGKELDIDQLLKDASKIERYILK